MVNFKNDSYVLQKECAFSAGCRILHLSIRFGMIIMSLKYLISCLVHVGSRNQVLGPDVATAGSGFPQLQSIQGPVPKRGVQSRSEGPSHPFLPGGAAFTPSSACCAPLRNCSVSVTRHELNKLFRTSLNRAELPQRVQFAKKMDLPKKL